MKIKTSELTGSALDWAVAQCEGVAQYQWDWYVQTCAREEVPENMPHCYAYSSQWSAGGPIIERERIRLSAGDLASGDFSWAAFTDIDPIVLGHTPLIAAMRCYVALKLGDAVEVPEELK